MDDDQKNVKKESLSKDYMAQTNDVSLPETTASKKYGWYIALIAAVVIIFLMGVAVDHAINFHRNNRLAIVSSAMTMRGGFGRGEAFSYNFSFPTVSTNQIQISGVVTAVNGSGFTIAGNGSSNSVQTNSSTQYFNASKVNVNDSVIVDGVTNNGTFTASQVIINN